MSASKSVPLYRLPATAHGRAKVTVGGRDGYLMLEIPVTTLDTDAADRLSRALGRMEAGDALPVGVVTAGAEARWLADQLDETRWDFVIVLQRMGEHREREWDTPGPFEVRAEARTEEALVLHFGKVATA